MKAKLLKMAQATGLLVASALVHAQNMQAMPTQPDTTNQTAQSTSSDTNASSYGGANMNGYSSSARRDMPASYNNSICTPGLSCNIYQGQ